MLGLPRYRNIKSDCDVLHAKNILHIKVLVFPLARLIILVKAPVCLEVVVLYGVVTDSFSSD